MRRILLVLAVAALMAAMIVAMAAPALAISSHGITGVEKAKVHGAPIEVSCVSRCVVDPSGGP